MCFFFINEFLLQLRRCQCLPEQFHVELKTKNQVNLLQERSHFNCVVFFFAVTW